MTDDDNVARLITEEQMLRLCIKADRMEAGKAEAVHGEIIAVVKAWARGELLPRSAAPLLAKLYSRAFPR